ncbi:ABC transporter permease [Alsobacter soli]|uniref:ABC transporter permease n=1 Tax=Alsobacter soli TaxID=2109933 RepID=A0A2T1HVV5_9HYPH|nr:ABC transporter permease [Alsobacter soli]PSC05796.1 ABC transporter permease [Alsobacter soli]
MFDALSISPRDVRLARQDLAGGVTAWPIWTHLGLLDIRQRYRRSRLGQFWITLSMALFVGGIGVVNASLFRAAAADYIPYLAASYIVWTLMSGLANDAAQVYVQAAPFLRQAAIPRTVFVLRVLARNAVAFAHNVVILPVVFALFGVWPGATALLALPGLALLAAAAFCAVHAVGVLATRFRDLPQIMQNAVQMAFFLTPVMWRPEQLGSNVASALSFNPFAVYLSLVVEPLLGRAPPASSWAAGVAMLLPLAGVAWLLFARFRARIPYWL